MSWTVCGAGNEGCQGTKRSAGHSILMRGWRLRTFHAEMSLDKRLPKAPLSIVTSSAIRSSTAGVRDDEVQVEARRMKEETCGCSRRL